MSIENTESPTSTPTTKVVAQQIDNAEAHDMAAKAAMESATKVSGVLNDLRDVSVESAQAFVADTKVRARRHEEVMDALQGVRLRQEDNALKAETALCRDLSTWSQVCVGFEHGEPVFEPRPWGKTKLAAKVIFGVGIVVGGSAGGIALAKAAGAAGGRAATEALLTSGGEEGLEG